MPLVQITTPTPHEPFEVRIAADVYTVTEGTNVTRFVEPERLGEL